MWTCSSCQESIEDSFDACWQCGTSRTGTPDPTFESFRDSQRQEASNTSDNDTADNDATDNVPDEIDSLIAQLESSSQNDGNESTLASGNRKCPICNQTLQSEEVLQFHIDICPKHGVWLDSHELSKILTNRKLKFEAEHAKALKEAKLQGKHSAITFGILSLLFD